MDLSSIAKYIICSGIFLVLTGGMLYFLSKVGIGIGKLPGDILVQKGNFTFYFPLISSIIISIVITIVFNILQKK